LNKIKETLLDLERNFQAQKSFKEKVVLTVDFELDEIRIEEGEFSKITQKFESIYKGLL